MSTSVPSTPHLKSIANLPITSLNSHEVGRTTLRSLLKIGVQIPPGNGSRTISPRQGSYKEKRRGNARAWDGCETPESVEMRGGVRSLRIEECEDRDGVWNARHEKVVSNA